MDQLKIDIVNLGKQVTKQGEQIKSLTKLVLGQRREAFRKHLLVVDYEPMPGTLPTEQNKQFLEDLESICTIWKVKKMDGIYKSV